MRPGIGRNASYAVGDFTLHLGLFLLREMWFVDCSCMCMCANVCMCIHSVCIKYVCMCAQVCMPT